MLIVPISLSKHFQPSNIAALQMMVTAAGILPRRPRSHGRQVLRSNSAEWVSSIIANRRYLANGDPRVDSLWKMFNNTY